MRSQGGQACPDRRSYQFSPRHGPRNENDRKLPLLGQIKIISSFFEESQRRMASLSSFDEGLMT